MTKKTNPVYLWNKPNKYGTRKIIIKALDNETNHRNYTGGTGDTMSIIAAKNAAAIASILANNTPSNTLDYFYSFLADEIAQLPGEHIKDKDYIRNRLAMSIERLASYRDI